MHCALKGLSAYYYCGHYYFSNRSSFAVDGDKMSVDGEVERVIQDFRKSKKPMG